MPKDKKTDIHAVVMRVTHIYSLLVNGYTGREIANDPDLQGRWGVKLRQMWVYIAMARKMLAEDAARVRDVERGKAIRRYERMYRKMDGVADYRGCLAAQARIDDLLALNEAKRIDVTTKGEAINMGLAPEVIANIGKMCTNQLADLIKAGHE